LAENAGPLLISDGRIATLPRRRLWFFAGGERLDRRNQLPEQGL